MAVINTDFSNFDLRTGECDVMELSDGLVPEIAQAFGYNLPSKPTPEDLGGLVDAVGPGKVLQENIAGVQEVLGTDDDAYKVAAKWVDRSGIQKKLDRSIWTPSLSTPDDVQATVLTGGVANWQDRGADILVRKKEVSRDYCNRLVYLAGNRIMDTPTEVANHNIKVFFEEYGRYPAEFEYAEGFVGAILKEAGFEISFVETEEASGDQQANIFAKKDFNPTKSFAFARVANAGVMLAGQYRNALQDKYRGFDADANNPQVFILTDDFPAAHLREELDPRINQNPLTALRMIIVTAKTIQQAKRIQRTRS